MVVTTLASLFAWLEHPAVVHYEFQPGFTPFSTFTEVACLVVFYLATIVLLQRYTAMRKRPLDLRTFSACYNLALSCMSLYLLASLGIAIRELASKHTFWQLLCDEHSELLSGRHVFVYYLIYLSKLLEFSDTFLLAVRGKPITFLHVYHHAITYFFTWLHLHDHTCVYWTMAMLNLAVHVVLYAYFALHEFGVRDVWWKPCLTYAQVGQFYVTFVPSTVALLARIIHAVDPALPMAHECQGSWRGAFLGMVILASYLYLFQRLLHEKYPKKRAGAATAAKGMLGPITVSPLGKESAATAPYYTPDHQVTRANMWTPTNATALRRRDAAGVSA